MPLINGGGLINPSKGGTSSSASQLALSDGLACYTATFSGITTTSFSHGLGTTDIVVEFKDSAGNLLIPDTWQAVNTNVISVEFPSPTTGDIVVVGCIESGLAPVQGGVTILEGLSGIIDLDSPNGSIDISTSGQVINLNAIFTAASGAILEQKCRDIDILSGLIGIGDAGQTSINGVSGQVFVSGINNEVTVSGQTILVSGFMNAASGAILEQKCRDIDILSGLIGTGGSASGNACSTLNFTTVSGIEFVMQHDLGTEDFTFELYDISVTPRQFTIPQNIAPSGVDHVIVTLDQPMDGRLVLVSCGGSGSGIQQSSPGSTSNLTDGKQLLFTPASGFSFVLEHGLNTQAFVWSMFTTDTFPTDILNPQNVAASGSNHILVELDVPSSGAINIIGISV